MLHRTKIENWIRGSAPYRKLPPPQQFYVIEALVFVDLAAAKAMHELVLSAYPHAISELEPPALAEKEMKAWGRARSWGMCLHQCLIAREHIFAGEWGEALVAAAHVGNQSEIDLQERGRSFSRAASRIERKRDPRLDERDAKIRATFPAMKKKYPRTSNNQLAERVRSALKLRLTPRRILSIALKP